MVKTIASILISFAILLSICIFEPIFIQKTIKNVETALVQLENKTKDGTATKSDAINLQNIWQDKKKILHIFIPHNDISYVDYWLGEAISYIETKNYNDALSKVQVLLAIVEQIPEIYALNLQNIF